MVKEEERVEHAIEILVYLTKNGPTTGIKLAKSCKCGVVEGYMLLLHMKSLALVIRDEKPNLGLRALWPGVYMITDAGRHYLMAFDELDPRAPFAALREQQTHA